VSAEPVPEGADPAADRSADPSADPAATAVLPAARQDEPAIGPRRATARFMLRHPAHLVALGFGSGLAPWAPGTVGTLWAWLAFSVFDRWLDAWGWGVVIAIGLGIGWWACTVTARHLQVEDPSAIVWDEIVAFWLVLWLVTPAGLVAQAVAFGLFRLFDAAKPGPVGWADQRFKARGRPVGMAQGFGIVFDDLVAAGCTLLVIAVWRTAMG
jgi:phosphatidylglycerophosphatase A